MPAGYVVDHPPVPVVVAHVVFSGFPGGVSKWIEFLADTGADATVIHPYNSIRIFDTDEAWEWVMSHPASRYGGAGGGLPHYRVAADITFRHDDGSVTEFPASLFVAHPQPTNRYYESLLGRDVLQHFVTTFNRTSGVTLELPA